MNNKKSQSYVGRAVKNYFSQNWGILLGLAILCVIFSIFGNNFLTQKNILNLLRTCATNCFLATGVQMAIILAGIDLTGGALAALSGVMTVAAFQWWGIPGTACCSYGYSDWCCNRFTEWCNCCLHRNPSIRCNTGNAVLLSWYCLSGSKRISCNSLW